MYEYFKMVKVTKGAGKYTPKIFTFGFNILVWFFLANKLENLSCEAFSV
jgi:hypothetical protein